VKHVSFERQRRLHARLEGNEGGGGIDNDLCEIKDAQLEQEGAQ